MAGRLITGISDFIAVSFTYIELLDPGEVCLANSSPTGIRRRFPVIDIGVAQAPLSHILNTVMPHASQMYSLLKEMIRIQDVRRIRVRSFWRHFGQTSFNILSLNIFFIA